MKTIRKLLNTVTAWAEDNAPQCILMMGLPASGKSTFIKSNLAKYYNHRMPHVNAYEELNSDRHILKHQFLQARKDYEQLKDTNAEKWDAETRFMTYRSNDGQAVSFPLSYEDFQRYPTFKEYWTAAYKPYYATYFGGRDKAKRDSDALVDKKIKSADVLIVDSTGTNFSKMLAFFEKAKAQGFTTSVVFLELPVEYSIARDQYRGATEGRSVGSTVIQSYVPELMPAFQAYLTSDIVDRVMHFTWNGELIKGKYVLKKEVKKYPRRG